jgi:signal transduction histidine kinase
MENALESKILADTFTLRVGIFMAGLVLWTVVSYSSVEAQYRWHYMSLALTCMLLNLCVFSIIEYVYDQYILLFVPRRVLNLLFAYQIMMIPGAQRLAHALILGIATNLGAVVSLHPRGHWLLILIAPVPVICSFAFHLPPYDTAIAVFGFLWVFVHTYGMGVVLRRYLLATQEMMAMKAQFLANFSHDIRTPLNSILLAGELTLDTPEVPKQVIESMHSVVSAAHALRRMVNETLEHALALHRSGADPAGLARGVTQKAAGIKVPFCTPVHESQTHSPHSSMRHTGGWEDDDVKRETAPPSSTPLPPQRRAVGGMSGAALHDAPVHLQQFLHDLVLQLRPLSSARRQHLNVQFDSVSLNGGAVMVDRVRLESLVTNLCANAFKYGREGGRVELSVSCHVIQPEQPRRRSSGSMSNLQQPTVSADNGGHNTRARFRLAGGASQAAPWSDSPRRHRAVFRSPTAMSLEAGGIQSHLAEASGGKRMAILRISVADDGPGIDSALLPHLFEPYKRGRVNAEGSGLGLHICKLTVDAYKGVIEVETEKDRGTIIRISMPLVVATDEDVRGTPRQNGRPNGKRASELLRQRTLRAPCHVLLVEDNQLNQRLLTRVLDRVGVTTSHAENGVEALRAMREQRFDAVLMDVAMPLMDGVECTRHARRLGIDAPIIAVTANGENVSEYLEAGMCAAVLKPVDVELLCAVLLEHVAAT